MFIPSLITILCVGGVTFYSRFLVALCKEWKPHRRGTHQESRLSETMPEVDPQSLKSRPSLAALQISEIRLNSKSHDFRRHRA